MWLHMFWENMWVFHWIRLQLTQCKEKLLSNYHLLIRHHEFLYIFFKIQQLSACSFCKFNSIFYYKFELLILKIVKFILQFYSPAIQSSISWFSSTYCVTYSLGFIHILKYSTFMIYYSCFLFEILWVTVRFLPRVNSQ